jgi:hypothetical protein
MPYQIRKIKNEDFYTVKNELTGQIHSKHTTLDKAKAQARLLGGKVTSQELKSFVKASYNPVDKIGDFILDTSISKPTVAVYNNPITGETKVVHRGTSGAKDWANNLSYVAGLSKHTSRYKDAERVQQRAEAKYGSQNIDTIGHSQGAVYSRDLGKNTKNIINLNPAYLGEKEGKNETVIRSSLDPVSALKAPIDYVKNLFGVKTNTHTIPATTLNPLTEHSTKILDKTNSTFGGKLFSQMKYTMNPQEFKHHLLANSVLLKKVRGHPLHQVLVDGLHESYHPNLRAAKMHVIGHGFFSGLKQGLHTAVKVGKSVAPLAGLVMGNPAAGVAAHQYLSAADTALGGRMMSGAGRLMSGGGHTSGGKMLKGSPEMKAHMAKLRAMRRR